MNILKIYFNNEILDIIGSFSYEKIRVKDENDFLSTPKDNYSYKLPSRTILNNILERLVSKGKYSKNELFSGNSKSLQKIEGITKKSRAAVNFYGNFFANFIFEDKNNIILNITIPYGFNDITKNTIITIGSIPSEILRFEILNIE